MAPILRIIAVAGVVALTAAGCGEESTVPAATTGSVPPSFAPDQTTPDETTPTSVVRDDTGGFGPPAPAPGEFVLTSTWQAAGRADVDERGCWWLTGNGDRGLLLAPPGTEVGTDGDTLVGVDGTVVADGTHVDIDGIILYGYDELPGGEDGRWGNYVTFCGPGRPIVLAGTMTIPADPDVEAAAAVLATTAAALFDEDHGCGYGFATGSADERWALRIDATLSEVIEPGTITLPDDRFDVVVTTGRHLFANHCDDVAEWFEPDQAVHAAWPIVAGTFEHPGSDGTGDCTQGAVTTTLVDGVIDVDGTPVALAPVTIENRSFGCFAG